MSKVKTQLVIEGKNNSKAAFDEVNGSLTAMSKAAKAASVALVSAFSVGALSSWVNESIKATAEMGRLAELSGTAAGDFQSWAYAARTVGIEQDKLGDIFKDVQDKVGDFLQTGGGEMANFFDTVAPKVGVTAEQFRNLSGPDALQLYVSSLEKANLSQSEMTFYLEAIANDATLLLPLLQQNGEGYRTLAAEAEKLGLVLSAQDAENAKEYERSVYALGAVSEGAGRQISAELLPTLNAMNGLLVDSATKSGYTAEIAKVLSFGLKVLASAAIVAGNGFGSLARFIGGAAAAAASAAKGEFVQAADIMRAVGEDNARETGLAMQRVTSLWDGTYEAAGKVATQAASQWKSVHEGMAATAEASAEKVKSEYDSIAKAAKERIKEVTAAEREAATEVARIRSERLSIEQRYADALAQLSGGGSPGDASYGNAQALKVGARNALKSGDLDEAQRQAAAALKMLTDLQAAGENTYGFQGFAKELQAIELEANRLQQSEADQKLADINKELDALKAKADIKITTSMSADEIAKAQQQVKDLAALLGKELVLTPVITAPAGAVGLDSEASQGAQQFAGGGFVRGPGTSTSDSIPAMLSNGEYVIRAAAVNKLGRGFLDLINNGAPVARFASGGLVEQVANIQPAAGRDLGRVDLHMSDGAVLPLLASADSFDVLLQRQADKRGVRRR